MKRTVLIALTFAVLSSLLYAQQKPSQHVSRAASIEIVGVKLHLGMTKAEVAERFVGTQITKMNEDFWSIGKSGTVRFKNQSLFFAGRSWINSGDDQIDALFGVVSSLNSEGYSACKVSSETLNVPIIDPDTHHPVAELSSKGEKVWIDCGNKSVLVIKAKNGDRLYEDVMEQLGNFIPDSN